MNSKEFIAKLKDVATNYKTLYVMGCFGAPMTDANKKRYTQNHTYNKQAARTKMIMAATSDTFGFDCVNLINDTSKTLTTLNAGRKTSTVSVTGLPSASNTGF